MEKTIIYSFEYYGVEKFERNILVGDGLWDLFTAKNLNIEFIGVGKKIVRYLYKMEQKRF